MIKKMTIALWLVGVWLAAAGFVHAQETEKVLIQVLGREGCVHCKEEKQFLDELAVKRQDFRFEYLDIGQEKYYQLWEKITDLERMPKATPITLVGQTLIQGFGSADTTGRMIEELIEKHNQNRSVTFEDYLQLSERGMVKEVTGGVCEEECTLEPLPLYVKIPILGSVDVRKYSLPVLASILGFVDGFNPCAMWVLVSFLIVLAQIESRKKMWLFAGTFIVAETIMYALIMTVWFTTWDFVQMDRLVTPVVGIVAVGGGLFFLWEWWKADGSCRVGNWEQKKRTQAKIQSLAKSKFGLLTFLGIITLAFSVNVIEFACSIGIPQAFTKVLELNGLNLWSSLVYVLIYIFFYMVDDLVVFGIALYSFEKIGVTHKYSKWSNLIGGILMIGLGMILLLKPDWVRML